MIKLLIIAISFLEPQAWKDSVGTETINGKLFVIHKVGEKETLYGISKRYGSTVEAVLQSNPGATGSLEVGQLLKVPYVKRTSTVKNTSGSGVIHVVAPKETLFSISKAYGISVDELKQLNNLSSNALSVGQELTVKKRNTTVNTNTATTYTSPVTSAPTQVRSKSGAHNVTDKETMFSIAKLYGITIQQLKEWNNLQGRELTPGQTLVVREPERLGSVVQSGNSTQTKPATTAATPIRNSDPVKEVKESNPQPKETVITITEGVKGSDEVLESGVAELIEGTDGNRKYLALHRTAPVGTILKVKNEMNGREVFVRVMGKLPDTALTDKLIIKISKSAYDRLGAIDQRFRVQVTYYK